MFWWSTRSQDRPHTGWWILVPGQNTKTFDSYAIEVRRGTTGFFSKVADNACTEFAIWTIIQQYFAVSLKTKTKSTCSTISPSLNKKIVKCWHLELFNKDIHNHNTYSWNYDIKFNSLPFVNWHCCWCKWKESWLFTTGKF